MSILFYAATPEPEEPAFVPTGTPYAWYDANQLSLSNDDPVSSWTDQSGNGYHLTGGNAPLFKTNIQNSKPAVYFDGVNDQLSYNWPDISQSNTYFIVYKLADTTDGGIFSGLTSTTRNYLYVESAGTIKLFASAIYNGPAADTDTHILVARFNGANSWIRLDGVASATANAGTYPMSGMVLGVADFLGNRKTMHVMELLVYNGSESPGDNETGLATKWGITL